MKSIQFTELTANEQETLQCGSLVGSLVGSNSDSNNGRKDDSQGKAGSILGLRLGVLADLRLL